MQTKRATGVNVLYVHSHDTGRYTSVYGHALRTPAMQRLAERGVAFRRAFTANPTCSPSRASLLTGMYAHSNGMMGLAHRGGRLNNPSQMLPCHLRDHGYETVLAGFQHVTSSNGHSIEELGYSRDVRYGKVEVTAGAGKGDRETAARAIRFLEEQAGDNCPWFLDVGFTATHRTATTPQGVQWHNGEDSSIGDERYVAVPPCLPDTPQTRADFADYGEAVARLDANIAAVLDALERTGQAERTLVICTTDHGIAFPHMKCEMNDHGCGVMLTLAGPARNNAGRVTARFDGGRVCDALVSQVDLFATVCDATGLAVPGWVQGVSLSPLADDVSASVRDEVFSEVNYHAAYEPKRSVRTDRYRYVRRLEVLKHPVLPNIDPSPSKSLLLERGLGQRPQQAEALYDLAFDPQEACNRIDDPAYAQVADDLRHRLERWMKQTDDPALSGEVWLEGMVVNPADGLHPDSEHVSVTGPNRR